MVAKRRKDVYARKDEIISFYSKGKNMNELMKLYRCDWTLIKRILQEGGVEIRKKGLHNSKGTEFKEGYKPTLEQEKRRRKNISESLKGKKLSEEHIEKIRKTKKSQSLVPWNKLNLDEEKIIEIYKTECIKSISNRLGCSITPVTSALYRNNIDIKGAKGFNKGKLSGEKHPNWMGGKSFEPYGIEFNNKLKGKIRSRDSHVCQECFTKQLKKKLHTHHIDYKKNNNSERNLISLCVSCHTQTNFNRNHWKEHFQMKVFIRELFNPQNIVAFNGNKQLVGVIR